MPSLSSGSRRAVWIAVLGVLMAQLPINAMSVSLTTIAEATGAATSSLQWVQSIYVLAMTAAVLSANAFAENFGRKRVMVTALWLMAFVSVIGILASFSGDLAVPLLLLSQALAGIGGGALLPTTLATISIAVPDYRQRGPYMALWGAGTTAGLTFGAVASGLILISLPWGWIFVPNFLIASVIALLTMRYLEESETHDIGLDVPGQIFAILAIVFLIFGVIHGGSNGWTSTTSLVSYAVAVLAGALFVYRELNLDAPLMDVRLFKSPGFVAACFAAAMALFSVVGTGFLFALFLGSAKQLTPLGIASYVAFMPGTALVVSPLVGKLLAKVRPQIALVLGLLLAGIGTFLIANTTEESSYLDVIWRIMIFGVAISIMFSSVAAVAVNSVPLSKAAMAGATNTAIRQVGGALGPAIIGSIYASQLSAGAAASDAFGAALNITTVLLVIAAIGVAVTTRRP